MHIHVLGICGTFMGSLAVLMRTGPPGDRFRRQRLPPMSTQLQAQGIELMQGYDPATWSRRRTW